MPQWCFPAHPWLGAPWSRGILLKLVPPTSLGISSCSARSARAAGEHHFPPQGSAELLEGVDVFLKLTWKYCFDRPLTAPAEPNYHLELPWDNWPHLLFKDWGGKKSFFLQTTAVEKCSGIEHVSKHIIKALNKCMMTSQSKKYFLCISDRSQPGPFQSHFLINKGYSSCFSRHATYNIWSCKYVI